MEHNFTDEHMFIRSTCNVLHYHRVRQIYADR